MVSLNRFSRLFGVSGCSMIYIDDKPTIRRASVFITALRCHLHQRPRPHLSLVHSALLLQ